MISVCWQRPQYSLNHSRIALRNHFKNARVSNGRWCAWRKTHNAQSAFYFRWINAQWPTPTINDNINLLFIYLLLFILITDDGASYCWFDKQKRRQQQQQQTVRYACCIYRYIYISHTLAEVANVNANFQIWRSIRQFKTDVLRVHPQYYCFTFTELLISNTLLACAFLLCGFFFSNSPLCVL